MKRYEKIIINDNIKFKIKWGSKESIIDKNNIETYHTLKKNWDINTVVSIYRNRKSTKLQFLMNSNLDNKFSDLIEINTSNVIRTRNGGFNLTSYKTIKINSKKDYAEDSNLEFISEISFKTKDLYNILYENKITTLDNPKGEVDIERKKHIISDESVSFIGSYGDSWCEYIYHRLEYYDSKLDSLLGTNWNKQNAGNIKNADLNKLLHYLKKKHNIK